MNKIIAASRVCVATWTARRFSRHRGNAHSTFTTTEELKVRATRNLPVTTGESRHDIRIVPDVNRQRVRAVCDRHSWESEWCYAGPGHKYDPLDGWTPSNAVIGRAAELGAVHLRSSSPRRVS